MAAAFKSSEQFFNQKKVSAGSKYRPKLGRVIVDLLRPFASSTVGRVNAENVPNDSHCSALQNWIVVKPPQGLRTTLKIASLYQTLVPKWLLALKIILLRDLLSPLKIHMCATLPLLPNLLTLLRYIRLPYC
jgi:hypothetical protein